MKVLIVLSLLLLSVSAKEFSLHLVDPTVETTCNVSDTRICGNYVWHDPERRLRADGTDYFEDSTHRRANIGTAFRHTGPDSFTTYDFEIFSFFDSYTMVVNGNTTINIAAGTTYDCSKPSNGAARCDKFVMNEADVYIKPGVPSIFTCQGNIYEGWKYPTHNDGLLMKLCKYSWTTEKRWTFISVSDHKCYPIKISDVKRDKLNRIGIVEETNFFNWNPNFGDFPSLPSECWNV